MCKQLEIERIKEGYFNQTYELSKVGRVWIITCAQPHVQ